MIVTVGPRKAAVLEDEPTAAYPWDRLVTETAAATTAEHGVTARATVEILREAGGMLPRALVGGHFVPDEGDPVIEIAVSDANLQDGTSVVSRLWRPLVPGLPAEFANAVVDGLRRRPIPRGLLRIDRAGYDPVESSPLAFELAAELLATVIAARAGNRDIESEVRTAIRGWP